MINPYAQRPICYLCLADGHGHTEACKLTPAGVVPLNEGASWREGVKAAHAAVTRQKSLQTVVPYDSGASQQLRREWWMHHGCERKPGALYGDDGEMQCHACHIDFLREPIDQLHEFVDRTRVWNAAEAAMKLKTEPPSTPAIVDLLRKRVNAERAGLFTAFNDYKDEETMRGRFAKACPWLSAHSVERMVLAWCGEMEIIIQLIESGTL